MGKKLFISNLDFEFNNDQLRELFASVGSVLSAVIATDRETRRSKGFAFVEMEGDDDATKAIEELNNKMVNGRPMKVVMDRGKNADSSFAGGATGDAPHRRGEQLPSIQRTQIFRRRKKLDPFLQDPSKTIDYKDVITLGRFVSERGKILSRRLTGLNAYNQRKVAKAIKRAQNAGLMPFTTVLVD
jgi:small subunit ribosomal protein S18